MLEKTYFFSWQSCTIDYLEEILLAFSPVCGPRAQTRRKNFTPDILIEKHELLRLLQHKLESKF